MTNKELKNRRLVIATGHKYVCSFGDAYVCNRSGISYQGACTKRVIAAGVRVTKGVGNGAYGSRLPIPHVFACDDHQKHIMNYMYINIGSETGEYRYNIVCPYNHALERGEFGVSIRE